MERHLGARLNLENTMSTDITISTDKPEYRTTGLVTASSGTYDVAVPTATMPSTTSQTFLVPTNLGDKPSLMRLVPFHSANDAATPSFRVIGWSTYTQTSGTKIYVPTLLADVACAYNATGGSIPSLSVNGVAQYFFHGVTVGVGVPTVNLYSPGTAAAAGTPPANIVLDTIGHQYITVQFESDKGTMGCFYAFM
jgi:hypothetical protein